LEATASAAGAGFALFNCNAHHMFRPAMNAISASTMRLLVSNIPPPTVSSLAELDGVLRLLGRLDNA
jgi:hypothetical protein